MSTGLRRLMPIAVLLFAAAVGVWLANRQPPPATPGGASPAVEPGVGKAPSLDRPARDTSPSPSQLGRRIEALEDKLRERTHGGETPSAALPMLEVQRARLRTPLSSTERVDVLKKLDNWERTFLTP